MDWAGLAGAAAQVVGTLAAQSSQNAANYDLNYENKAWQLKMMNLQNYYNSPLQQRRRLEQAGINPALAMQDTNPNMAASNPNLPSQIPMDMSSIGAGISNALGYLLQSKKNDAEIGLLKEQASAERIDNMTRHALKLQTLMNMKAEYAKLGKDTEYIDWQIDREQALFDAEQKKQYHEIMNIDSSTRLQNANAYIAEVSGKFSEIEHRLGISFTSSQIREVNANIKRVVAETGVLSEQKLYQILSNAKIIPDVKKALRMSNRMDENPNETDILDALGLWLDPVTDAIDVGSDMYKARSGRIAVNKRK